MDMKQADANFDWIERALEADAREYAGAYVADEGFTSSVMARLPQRAVLPAWRGPVLALLWLIAGAGVVVALPDLFYEVFRGLVAIVVAQPLTLSRIAAAVLVLGALTWSTIVYAMRAE